MNCDLAFDLLTRGPFPAGDPETDAALERHLAACHDCRRLAEAMRPAVDLFHETMSEQDVESLPCYRGALPVAAEGGREVAVADVPVPAVAVRPRPIDRPAPPIRRGSLWSFVAVCAACVMLGAGLMSLREAPQRDATIDAARAVTALQLVDDPSERRLVALGTVDECRPTFTVSGTGSGHLLQCCSVCHTADASSAAAQSAAIANSCVVCHAPLDGSGDAASRPFGGDGVESPGKLL